MRSSFLGVLTLVATTTLHAQNVPQPAAPAGSHKSSTSKFFLGGGLNGSAISMDGSDVTENGGGATLLLGYGFSPRWAVYIEGAAASIQAEGGGDYILSHGDLGVRFHFANRARAWVPFLDAAITGRAVQEDEVTICNGTCETGRLVMSGGAFTFGGGVMFYPSAKFALTATLKLSAGEFSEVTFGNTTVSGLDEDATSSRFGIGVVWFPQR